MAPERPSFPLRGAGRIEALRARIRGIEAAGRRGGDAAAVAFGIEAVDSRLPGGGLARGALHEVIAGHPGAATGFCAALLARLVPMPTAEAAVLWCTRPRLLETGLPYGPGLARFGLEPARLIVVRAGRDADVLWGMEEALRCRRLAAVLGETGEVTLTESRRLQLAAEAGGVTAVLLRPAGRRAAPPPSAAATRWRIEAAPSVHGAPRWRVELFRCRGGADGRWLMEWRDETGDFALAAPVRHRPAVPRDSRLAG